MPVIEIEDEEDDNEFTGVELGFVDKFHELEDRNVWKVWSTGKVGGRPEWLETRTLPSPRAIVCDHCAEPMYFLAQMYAPVDELPIAFHRVLYVFCCRHNTCLRKENGGKGAIRVLRSQLPEKNELYEPDFKHSKKVEELDLMDDDELDALEESEWKERVLHANEAEMRTKKALNAASEWKKTGNLHFSQKRWNEAIECYTKGLEQLKDVYIRSPYRLLPSSADVRDLICVLRSNRCQALMSSSNNSRYREALLDADYVVAMKSEWVKAHYRRIKTMRKCNMDTKHAKRTYENLLKRLKNGKEQDEITAMYLLRELNLECESEPVQVEEEEENSSKYSDVKIEEDDEDDTTEDDLHKALGPRSWKADKIAVAFQKRVKPFPDQCVRYCRWHETESVLWPSEERQCSSDETDIPKCPRCGASRKFELQITPQMLHHLHLGTEAGSTDFETIVVYTCINSCATTKGYVEEYAWAQTSQKNFMC